MYLTRGLSAPRGYAAPACGNPQPERLEARRLLAATYYVSPSGSDGHAGTSPAAAWRTTGAVNAADLGPGDRVLFEGGGVFTGGLAFGAEDAGTPAEPVTVGSYGAGRATVAAGAGTGILVHNAGGFRVEGLVVVGDGAAANTGDGVSFYNDLPGDVKLPGVTVDDVDVWGFGKWGVAVGGGAGKSGFSDVRITRALAHDNARGGILTYGVFSASPAAGYANANVYVGDSRAYRNPGVPGLRQHSGNGIVLGDVDGGTIERCVAYENGWLSDNPGGGPVGIWAWDANRVTIQYNESHHNRTGGRADGGGFDLDGGVTNSVVQYNYSHDNDGAGFLVAQFPSARPMAGNTVRFNVSQNDGRKNGYGAIHVWNGDARRGIGPLEVYHNTVYATPTGDGSGPLAVRIDGATVGTHFRNNLFVTTGGREGDPMLEVTGIHADLHFQGNAYWSGGPPVGVRWAGLTFAGLAGWRERVGQESLDGAAVGIEADPKLTSPGTGLTLDDPYQLATLTPYRLQPDSPLRSSAVSLLHVGIDDGERDFFDTLLPPDGADHVGAHAAA